MLGLPRLVLVLCVLLGALLPPPTSSSPAPQGFELPVQLVGFPVIILAVRISRFVKQLSYALNPQTYRSSSNRQVRDLHAFNWQKGDAPLDVAEAEKRLVAEMGEHVCIYERVCAHYAQLAMNRKSTDNHDLDWENVFSKYKSSPEGKKQFYLLSVFLGDIVASPTLCHQLVKKGRGCGGAGDLEATD